MVWFNSYFREWCVIGNKRFFQIRVAVDKAGEVCPRFQKHRDIAAEDKP